MRAQARLLRWLAGSTGDRSGVAAVEFALLLPLLIAVMIAMLDVAYAFHVKLRLSNALTAAAQYAFQEGRSVSASGVTAFNDKVATVLADAASLVSPPAVTVLFNNAADGSQAANYYCVTGSPATWVSTGSVVASCGGAVSSGRFVTIRASARAASLFPSDPIFGTVFDMTDAAIVRVQ